MLVEPFFGGSHKAFCEGLAGHSQWDFSLLTQPAQVWKWRMRTAHLHLARRLKKSNPGEPALVLASDFLDLAGFLGLARKELGQAKAILYFHENQLMYPVRNPRDRDLHFAVTNIMSYLAADHVVFNSEFHRQGFFATVEQTAKTLPKPPNLHLDLPFQKKSSVLYPGIEPPPGNLGEVAPAGERTIVFNSRWEHDKNPEEFFQALYELDAAGVAFRLKVLGQSFEKSPKVFAEAKERLASHIDHFGYCEDRTEYWQHLCSSDIVVSTAIHEFFGIAVMEAICCGAFPVLPRRLSYPELLPASWHQECLYDNPTGLKKNLNTLLEADRLPLSRAAIKEQGKKFQWTEIIGEYDALFERVAESS